MNYLTLLSFFTLSLFSVVTQAQIIEKKSDLSDQTNISITIYNNNLALIKDQRKIILDKGFNQLAFRGVSAKIRPETAILRSINHNKSIKVLEQNFDYDLLTPTKLLDKYVGKQIKLATINPVTGKKSIEQATVLSTHQGVILKIGNRIETNPTGQYIFDNIPDNLRDQPTLVTQLNSSSSQVQQLELSYLSSGLSWKADYVAELNANDSLIDILGWVTLNNTSGTDYRHAKLQLVAGDVNRVSPQNHPRVREMKSFAMVADANPMREESLFEYHLYGLNRPTSILNNQTKQVSLLSAHSVPVNKELVLNGASYYYNRQQSQIGQKLKVGVFVQIENKQAKGLGMPIPKGIVRVYKKDSHGNAQFIGEDNIDHTPKNETIRLKLGNAFDVTANKKQTSFSKGKHILPGRNSFETAYQIELKNAKSTAVTVTVREPIPGDWKILQESQPHQKIASGTAEWKVKIPAESSKLLNYRVLVEY
ncbi:MAG: DUF4139 domain-containing protein [Methylococcales bacterium]